MPIAVHNTRGIASGRDAGKPACQSADIVTPRHLKPGNAQVFYGGPGIHHAKQACMVGAATVEKKLVHHMPLSVVMALEPVCAVPDGLPARSRKPAGCFGGVDMGGLDQECPAKSTAVGLLGHPVKVFDRGDLVRAFSGAHACGRNGHGIAG